MVNSGFTTLLGKPILHLRLKGPALIRFKEAEAERNRLEEK